MNEELTREVLEALGSCMNTCGDDCKARGVCLPGQSYVRRKLATALLAERAKPKGDVWENAPDNAGHAWIAYYETGFEETPIKSLGFVRQLPKSRARQIAEKEGHRLAEIHGWNAAGKELVTNAMESAINKYAEELKGEA